MDQLSTLTLNGQQVETPASHLRCEYEAQRALFQAQPPAVQNFLESQSLALAQALTQETGKVRFKLPQQVMCAGEKPEALKSTPVEQCEQAIGGLLDRIKHKDLIVSLSERLATLEASLDLALATGAALMRYTTATTMIRSLLPSGRSVNYQARPGEEIPSQPVEDDKVSNSNSRSSGFDAHDISDLDDGMAQYLPEMRRFYLPQWVAFDAHGRLLVNTTNEARVSIGSMQAYMKILRAAARLAPYILADTEYQHKRYGMIGQLVNQGRLLARHETEEIIQGIWQRVRQNRLNRGLSLSLPYFDDQEMELKELNFVAIPGGRIMFMPAFLVLAVCEAQAKVTRDDRMSPSTRQHLLAELKALENAFDTGDQR